MAKKTNYTSASGVAYYRIRKKIGIKEDGKPIYKTFLGSCKSEAEKLVEEYLKNTIEGQAANAETVIFSALFKEWLEVVRKPKLQPSGWNRYECIYRLYMIPMECFNMKLKDVKSIHIQRDINKIKSPYTVEWVHLLLSMFFKYAIAERFISHSPSKNLILPKKVSTKKNKEYLDKDELDKLVNAAKSDDDFHIFVFAAFTGLRQGEILALTHKDIDLKKGFIQVTKSVRRVTVDTKDGRKTQTLVSPPKTMSGKRQIPIFKALKSAIAHQIAIEKAKYIEAGMRDDYNPDALLFSSPSLGYLRSDRLTNHWKDVQRKLGIDDPITFHQLRHTFCTMLCERNVPLAVAAELMGHASIDVVAEVYSHIRTNSKEDAIDSLDVYFNKKKSKSKKQIST